MILRLSRVLIVLSTVVSERHNFLTYFTRILGKSPPSLLIFYQFHLILAICFDKGEEFCLIRDYMTNGHAYTHARTISQNQHQSVSMYHKSPITLYCIGRAKYQFTQCANKPCVINYRNKLANQEILHAGRIEMDGQFSWGNIQKRNEFFLFLILTSVPTGTMFWNLGEFKAKLDLSHMPVSLGPVHT